MYFLLRFCGGSVGISIIRQPNMPQYTTELCRTYQRPVFPIAPSNRPPACHARVVPASMAVLDLLCSAIYVRVG